MAHLPIGSSCQWRLGRVCSRHERRRKRRYTPLLGWLEDRTLLSVAADALPPHIGGNASPLPLDSRLFETIGALGANNYQVSPDQSGRLMVSLRPVGFTARLSIIDSQGTSLWQSDGVSASSRDSLIDVNVSAGDYFLKVQSLDSGGTYTLNAHLDPAVPPFQTIPSTFTFSFAPIASSDFNGDGLPDLVAPDGIHLGLGNGTFASALITSPVIQDGFTATALAVGDFNNDGLWDIAVAETSSDASTGELRVIQNEGKGQFQVVATFAVDPFTSAIQVVDVAGGKVDLAVANLFYPKVSLFLGDGQGGFTQGPDLEGVQQPAALTSYTSVDGNGKLVIADDGDPNTGAGAGLLVYHDDGQGGFVLGSTIPLPSAPSSVVAGKLRDGRVLLATANALANNVSIVLGQSDGTFDVQPSYPVGQLPQSIVMGDFNGDGSLDLAVADQNSNEVSVLLGNGDGAFQPQLRFGTGMSPRSLVVAELNGDNRADLAVGNLGDGSTAASTGISVLLGRGDGTFQDNVVNPVGDVPASTVTADFNRDGHLDLVTANTGSNDISILLGKGDGTFLPPRSFSAGNGPKGLAWGDFNGDGRLDLAVADGGDPNHNNVGQGVLILMGNGDGTFQAPIFEAAGTNPSSIVTGDFNGDGIWDLAVANKISNDVTILLGQKHGGFLSQSVPLADAGGRPIAIAAGDFNGDKNLDLVVADQNTNHVSILLGDGQGGFTAQPPILLQGSTNAEPAALAAGDFNGDGVTDIAVATFDPMGKDLVSILLSNPQGGLTLQPPIELGSGVVPNAITLGRLFGGSALDLAITGLASQNVILLKGDGKGGFQPSAPIVLGNGGTATSLTPGDFSGSGRVDLAVARTGPNDVAIELNQGAGQFASSDTVGFAPSDRPVVADFSGDGILDLAVINGAGDILFRRGDSSQPGSFDSPITINGEGAHPARDIAAVHSGSRILLAAVDANDNLIRLYAYSYGEFTLISTLATGLGPAQIVSADLNGVGNSDMIIRNALDGTLTVYLSDGAGGTFQRVDIPVGNGVSSISIADVNQDGRPDILFTDQASGQVGIIINSPGPSFGEPMRYRAGEGLSALLGGSGSTSPSLSSLDGTVGVAAIALMKGGPTDLVALNSGAETLGVLNGLGGGRFANPWSLPTYGHTSYVAVADLNGDGNPDLVTLGPNGVTVWLSNGQGNLIKSGMYSAGADPNGLAIADINNDGFPDLIIGNSFGDVLLLRNVGKGAFQTPTGSDQNVSLAVAGFSREASPRLVISDQARDRVIFQVGASALQPTVLGDHTTGLNVPGAVVTADLNGNGLLDAVVVDSGGNEVYVYPANADGTFGSALNGGIGFPVGTNPVAVTFKKNDAENGLDLIVVNKGSNDISILLFRRQGDSFTYIPGPRLQTGVGPVSATYKDLNGDGIGDILVSDSGSNDLRLIPGVGGGFFNDGSPTIYPLAESPGAVFAGNFGVGTGPSIAVLMPSANLVALFSNLGNATPTFNAFPSGGVDPISAFIVHGADGFDSLVIANNGDAHLGILEGNPQGASLSSFDFSQILQNPTAIALGSFQNNTLDVYAAMRGEESVQLLTITMAGAVGSAPAPLPGELPPPSFVQANGGQGLSLLAFRDSALPLIATLLLSYPETAQTEEEATTGVSVGQGPLAASRSSNANVYSEDEDAEGNAESQAEEEEKDPAPWMRSVLGLDEAFERFGGQTREKPPLDQKPMREAPVKNPRAEEPASAGTVTGEISWVIDPSVIDAAIESLAEQQQGRPAILSFEPDLLAENSEASLEHELQAITALILLCGDQLSNLARRKRPSFLRRKSAPERIRTIA